MKLIVTITFLFAGILMIQVIDPGHTINLAVADTTYANPNGTSELAELMREMQAFSNNAKADINSGKAPASYPVNFDKIHTAKISDGMSKSDYYKSFADLYIMAVKNYASSAPAQRVETYNNMVSACLACHSQHCPGPVPVIKKMMIPTDK
jgi:hypothetical protein